MGTMAERRAARERVGAYHQAQLARLLSHVAAAIDRYRDGEIDACTVAIHHYRRAATQLWKFCFAGGGGTPAELIAGILDRMTADAETIDCWERHTATTPMITSVRRAPARRAASVRVMSAPWEGSRCGPWPAAVIYLTGHAGLRQSGVMPG